MTVVESDDLVAVCNWRAQMRKISMLLVGEQPPGTKVLVHLCSATRVLDAEEAKRIEDALDGLAAAVAGRDFDQHFADLIDRDPQLPDHLIEKDR